MLNLKIFIPQPRSQSGQGMVEFALILAVLIGLFIGAFEIMTLFRKRTDLEAATRLGAREASESWITDGLTDATFEADITQYVYDEMERMGYDQTWMATDDNVKVTVRAFEFDGAGNLVPSFNGSGGEAKLCTYGQYIKVTVDMKWRFAVLPINTLLSNNTIEGGSMTEELLLRCWRGT